MSDTSDTTAPTVENGSEGSEQIEDGVEGVEGGEEGEGSAMTAQIQMTSSQRIQFLFGLFLMGALFLYQLQTSSYILQKLRTSRKSIWITMAIISLLLLFYLFCMVYGIAFLIINGFSMLPWWMLLFPTAIEMVTTFSLTVLRIMRLRAAFPITPLGFRVLVGLLVPLTVMSAVSLVANAVWTAGGIGYEYILYMPFLHPWNWEVGKSFFPPSLLLFSLFFFFSNVFDDCLNEIGIMIASILADSAFLAAVSLATSRTEFMRQKPQLTFKTTLLIILHILLSTFFVAQLFIEDNSYGFTIVSFSSFPSPPSPSPFPRFFPLSFFSAEKKKLTKSTKKMVDETIVLHLRRRIPRGPTRLFPNKQPSPTLVPRQTRRKHITGHNLPSIRWKSHVERASS